MDTNSHAYEQKLAEDIKQIISLANEGKSPDEAVALVAEKENFSPEMVKTACAVFNKSKTVAYFKQASSADRGKSFDIADPSKVLNRVFNMNEKIASSKTVVPEKGFEDDEVVMEKVASEPENTDGLSRYMCRECGTGIYKEASEDVKCPDCDTDMTCLDKTSEELFNEAFLKAKAYEGMIKKAEEDFKVQIGSLKRDMHTLVKDIARNMEGMNKRKQEKVARIVVNGYQELGKKALQLIQSHMHTSLPEVEKTAYSAVFPSEEPFISISKLFNCVEELKNTKNAQSSFEKKATVPGYGATKFLQWLTSTESPTRPTNLYESAAQTISRGHNRAMGGLLGAIDSYSPTRQSRESLRTDFADVLGPGLKNTLKEIDTQKSFLQLALYDPSLKNYSMPELADAYNMAIETVRDPQNIPSLRSTMMRLLEQGGIRSVEQTVQEQKARSDFHKDMRMEQTDMSNIYKQIKSDLDTKIPDIKKQERGLKETWEKGVSDTKAQEGDQQAKFKDFNTKIQQGDLKDASKVLPGLSGIYRRRAVKTLDNSIEKQEAAEAEQAEQIRNMEALEEKLEEVEGAIKTGNTAAATDMINQLLGNNSISQEEAERFYDDVENKENSEIQKERDRLNKEVDNYEREKAEREKIRSEAEKAIKEWREEEAKEQEREEQEKEDKRQAEIDQLREEKEQQVREEHAKKEEDEKTQRMRDQEDKDKIVREFGENLKKNLDRARTEGGDAPRDPDIFVNLLNKLYSEDSSKDKE